mgnify:CR=1 FL=1
MFFFFLNISLWDFSWLFAFEYFFLNFACTILAPTAINQQKFSFFLQDQEGTKTGCKPTTTDLIHLSTEEYEHLLSDEEYEHDDSADSLRVKLP